MLIEKVKKFTIQLEYKLGVITSVINWAIPHTELRTKRYKGIRQLAYL